jgi:tRNA (cytidine/uridine-2'-O-)-methyltransferase
LNDRVQLEFRPPDPPLQVVLVEPQIPQNTGNVARLCAATGTVLHLVEPLGFEITDAKLKRAGLDYWDAVDVMYYPSLDAFLESSGDEARLHLFSTRAPASYTDCRFQPGDFLLFGSETKGLAQPLLDRHPDAVFGIPILLDNVRSLNLSTSVGIIAYEALRQIDCF